MKRLITTLCTVTLSSLGVYGASNLATNQNQLLSNSNISYTQEANKVVQAEQKPVQEVKEEQVANEALKANENAVANKKEAQVTNQKAAAAKQRNEARKATKKAKKQVRQPAKTTAPKTEAPKTVAPATQAPKAVTPQTKAPQTVAPQTVAPKTAAPKTVAPVTKAPQTTAPAKTETPTTSNSSISNYATQVLQLVNQERAKEGLKALTTASALTSASNKRAQETMQSFSHTRPNGSSFFTALTEFGVKYSAAGENIAYGQRTPQEVVTAWMNSPGHRANIMNGSFGKLGVGVYQASNGTIYWAQLFTN